MSKLFTSSTCSISMWYFSDVRWSLSRWSYEKNQIVVMYRFHSARYLPVFSFARWSNPMRFLCVMHRLLNRSLIIQNIISVLMCHLYQFCVMIFSCSRKSISLMTLLRHRSTSPSKDRSDTRASDNVGRRSLRCYIFTLRKCLAREMDQATHFQ